MIKGVRQRCKTTRVEQLLLMITISILPLQIHLPTIGGASILFIMFLIMGSYLLLRRLKFLLIALSHPVFLSGYALIGVGLFMEFINGSTGFYEIARIGFMIIGGIFVASFCRDQKALLYGIYGFLFSSIWLSTLLFLSIYGSLNIAKAENFDEATQLRVRIFEASPIANDLNTMSFLTAQGAVIALALALTTKIAYQRYGLLAVTTFCSIATLLPMSRGGTTILIISCAIVVYTYGVKHLNVLIAIFVLAFGMFIWVPDAIYSRLTFTSTPDYGEKIEGRARVYSAAIKHLPDYILTGVGITNFYGEWGKQSGFLSRRGYVSGSHNCFVQVTLYWGLIGLAAFLMIIWQAYRCAPHKIHNDPLRLCLLGAAASVLLLSLCIHQLFAKEFSLILGMLVGANIWIWPQRILIRRNNVHGAPYM
ncbi:O-antigen ligase family protein [Nitrospira sp. M1]